MPTIKGNLVGIKFYRGASRLVEHLKGGEDVLLVREPSNQYDPNAVAVYAKIGHIDRSNAAILVDLIDGEPPNATTLGAKTEINVPGEAPQITVELEGGE